MPHDIVVEMVRMGFIKVMDRHFAKLYTKIENIKMELLMLNRMVASIVDENKSRGKLVKMPQTQKCSRQQYP